MRKNELIKLLQNIKGNPEIVIWNRFVEDVQAIEKEIVPAKLYKLSFEGYKERVNLERVLRDKLPELPDDDLEQLYKQHNIGQWELFNYYPPEDDDRGYKSKTVYVLEPKRTNKSTWDRMGVISY